MTKRKLFTPFVICQRRCSPHSRVMASLRFHGQGSLRAQISNDIKERFAPEPVDASSGIGSWNEFTCPGDFQDSARRELKVQIVAAGKIPLHQGKSFVYLAVSPKFSLL